MAANNPPWRCRRCLNNGIVTNCNEKHHVVSHLGSNAANHPNHSMGPFRCTACPFVGVRRETVLRHITTSIRNGHTINHARATAFRDLGLVAAVIAEANECALPHLNAYVAPGHPNLVNVAADHVAAVARHAATDPAAATAITNQAAVVVPLGILAAILAAGNPTAAAAIVNQAFGVQALAPPAAPPALAPAAPGPAPPPPAPPAPAPLAPTPIIVVPAAFTVASSGPLAALPTALSAAITDMVGGAQPPAVQLPAVPQVPLAGLDNSATNAPIAGSTVGDNPEESVDGADEHGVQADQSSAIAVQPPQLEHEVNHDDQDGESASGGETQADTSPLGSPLNRRGSSPQHESGFQDDRGDLVRM